MNRSMSTATSAKSKSDKPLSREEQRKTHARSNASWHAEQACKRKDWLARHPEVVEQEAREKEQRRLNAETLRMLASMKETAPKKKVTNLFAALLDDSDTDEETDANTLTQLATTQDTEDTHKDEAEAPIVFNAGNRFDWADEE